MRARGGSEPGAEHSDITEDDEERLLAQALPTSQPTDAEAHHGIAGKLATQGQATRISWSFMTLGITLSLLYIVIWTLPAPSMYSKVALLRQSWHLSEVLRESPTLRKQLEGAEAELVALRAKVKEAKSKSDALQAQVGTSDNTKSQLQSQLETVKAEVATLQGQRKSFQQKLEEEKTRQQDLSAKMKKLKEAELPVLNSIPDDDGPST
ncbi:unnamed protein product [Polarella glacialis]|uniref:Uncharacterized protein n=1 Tax=Polarella glacialis TaxID=89957 RepID=A0A813D4R5_POLGL|nr:unnamed protein product [Polarella glacialis]|mmetsp:Transcript_46695/g.75766  ORF Transcript_46695/g.75766 Transcript_46695/m.75766 type:complete len:209 (-) Transcript_46695:172-798(-)